MQRTPPRKSPRLNPPQATVASNLMEQELDAVAAASTTASMVSAPLAEPLISPNVPISVSSAAQQGNILEVMQNQLHALECQLKNTQAMLKERDLQCQTLTQNLQANTVQANAPITPPLLPTSSAHVVHSSFTTTTVPTSPPVVAPSTTTPQTSGALPSYLPPFSTPLAEPFSILNRPSTNQILVPNHGAVQPNVSVPTTFPLLSSGYHIPYASMSNCIPSTGIHHNSNAAWIPSASTSSMTQSQPAIPRKILDLPEFRGHAEDWPMFFTAFTETTAAYNYSSLENSMRLQKSLKGEAKEIVKSLLIQPGNVNAVIEQLRFHFGRPEQLIRSQLKQIREIAPVSEGFLEKLIPFATKVRNFASFLQSANSQQYLCSATLLDELIDKLPMSKRVEWAAYAAPLRPFPTILDFSNWASAVANLICTVQGHSGGRSISESRRRVVLHATEEQRVDAARCHICKGRHKVPVCRKFLDRSVPDRWTDVKHARLCFTCLNLGHSTRNCHSRKACGVDGCKRSHHKLLHEDRSWNAGNQQELKQPQVSIDENEAVLSCSTSRSSNSLLFRVLPVTLFGPTKQVDTYALLDEGSSITMMDSVLVNQLGLKGHQHRLNIQWFGERNAQENTTVVNVHISGAKKKRRHLLRNVYCVQNLRLPTQTLNCRDIQEQNKVKCLLAQPYSNVTPQLLIGLDHCHLGLPKEMIHLSDGGPYAANTELGWVVFGSTKVVDPVIRTESCLVMNVTNDDALHTLVKDYFDTESFGVRPAPVLESEDDVRARSILKATTIKVNGRFQTGLLWNNDTIELPDSYGMAVRRLSGIERKMKKDNSFAVAYNGIIQGYVAKKYARKLQPSDAAVVGPRTWYLPHFAVTNPNKPGKLRLVFDAAATVKGISLNSCLLKGPQQYQPMPSVLFSFRKGSIAVCGDIREMFHQVLIRPEDRCSQRFLWRNGNDTQPPEVYEMLVMTFGAACSPCAAEYVKTVNALEHRNHSARAVEAILRHHYVDDYVDSFESLEEAIRITRQVCDIHKDAGFELRSFTSNSQKVLQALTNGVEPETSRVHRRMEDSLGTEKVLGMYWQPSSDTFRYHLKFHRVDANIIAGQRTPTKRQLLSVVMSVYDPLGFLCNLLIHGKLLMREVWKRDIQWDEELPGDIDAAWRKWCQLISEVVKFQIPRHYFSCIVPEKLQLHVFSDASEDAFAAVAYWRATNVDGAVAVVLVCAKTKCAPLKPMTIPRLELQAATLGTRLMKTIIDEHSLKVDRTFLWSDSKTVIKWIGSGTRRYKPFVAHRVAEILAVTDVSNWRWLPTQHNVADEATRSNSQVDFSPSSRWLSGPKFLWESEETWPSDRANTNHHEEEDDEELRPKFALLSVSYAFIEFIRFSSFTKLKRTVAWVIRFVNRCRKRNLGTESLTLDELKASEVVLCRQVQSEAYSAELQQIEEGKDLSRKSSLYKLSPYKDDDGILRVNGRIDAASWLPYSARRPIILPPDHAFSHLVAHHHHQQMKHQNIEAAICEVRSRYWIPKLRQVMRKVMATCNVCKIARASPVTPIMGPLPEDRVTPYMRPFSFTGIDYFGPVEVSVGRRTEKRWIALFTCLVIRAIHLEIARDLSTDACIVVMRNFMNRRGVPVRIRSDNGKNFIGADREAKRFSDVFDCGRIQDELATRGVEWVFNCPRNPSEGGIWERMVQCVKKVLRHTLKEVTPREHTLQCLIVEAENVVNSRPLTHLPISIDQEEPLTPNHFLLGASNTAQTPSSREPVEKLCSLRKQWRIARQLRDRFWKRWIAEYLPTLTRRVKWCQRTTPLKKGQLVFICDPNLPRSQWCRGRVVRVHHGADGEIRRADVSTRSGVLQRPVSKLAVLSVDNSESD